MSEQAIVADASYQAAQRPKKADRYFLVMSLIALAIVLVGFCRTFFLRPLFDVPTVPWYVIMHGIVMSAWIALLAAQTSLIAARRPELHRILGIGGAFLAAAVVAAGLLLTLTIPALFRDKVPSPNGQPLPFSAAFPIMWGNFGSVLLFATFVIIALYMRRRPETHKRLALLASFALVGPAAGRMYGFPELWGITSTFPVITSIFHALPGVMALGLPLTLVAHDLVTRRRLIPATVWGVLVNYAVGALFMGVIPRTAFGLDVWNALA